MAKHDFLLSIIIPVYNEEQNIAPLLEKLIPIAEKYQYEIIFINDGSKDKTADKIAASAHKNTYIKLLSFVRNFGHQMALTAGYQEAKGDCVVSIDADLQDPPELIAEMVDEWRKGFKIVYAKRSARNESFFKKLTAELFYHIMNALSDSPIPHEVGDFRLLDREIVDLLNKIPEKSRFLRGLVAWSGYPATTVTFVRNKRTQGQTHYPLSKMINFALDGVTSFSSKPLKIASYLGFVTSIVGFLGIAYAMYRRFFLPHEYWVTGWTAIFVSIMFFGGIQLITIGIIGEYIGKIYQEVQGRPPYLIDKKINL